VILGRVVVPKHVGQSAVQPEDEILPMPLLHPGRLPAAGPAGHADVEVVALHIEVVGTRLAARLSTGTELDAPRSTGGLWRAIFLARTSLDPRSL
jgi:hypothetical protein